MLSVSFPHQTSPTQRNADSNIDKNYQRWQYPTPRMQHPCQFSRCDYLGMKATATSKSQFSIRSPSHESWCSQSHPLYAEVHQSARVPTVSLLESVREWFRYWICRALYLDGSKRKSCPEAKMESCVTLTSNKSTQQDLWYGQRTRQP